MVHSDGRRGSASGDAGRARIARRALPAARHAENECEPDRHAEPRPPSGVERERVVALSTQIGHRAEPPTPSPEGGAEVRSNRMAHALASALHAVRPGAELGARGDAARAESPPHGSRTRATDRRPAASARRTRASARRPAITARLRARRAKTRSCTSVSIGHADDLDRGDLEAPRLPIARRITGLRPRAATSHRRPASRSRARPARSRDRFGRSRARSGGSSAPQRACRCAATRAASRSRPVEDAGRAARASSPSSSSPSDEPRQLGDIPRRRHVRARARARARRRRARWRCAALCSMRCHAAGAPAREARRSSSRMRSSLGRFRASSGSPVTGHATRAVRDPASRAIPLIPSVRRCRDGEDGDVRIDAARVVRDGRPG